MQVDLDALWDYSEPHGSEERFRALIPEAEQSGDVSYFAQLLTQLARAEGLQGNFGGANHTLARVETLLPQCPPVARIRFLLECGRVLNTSGKVQESIPYFLDAWTLAREEQEEFYAVDAAHMLGIVESPLEQLVWSRQALEIAESSDRPRTRTWLGPLYNNLGWSYHDLGKYEEALAIFERSLAWRREQEQPRETRLAAWTVARCLRSLGRVEEALTMQRANLECAREVHDPEGYIEEEIGECLLALDRGDEAGAHIARAFTLLSSDPWLAQHEAARLQRLKELAGM